MSNAVDMGKVRARRAELKRQSEEQAKNSAIMKLRDGAEGNKIRILPPWSPEGLWAKKAYYHFRIFNKTFVCLETYGQTCPVCETNKQLRASKTKEETEQAFQWRRKERFFANLVSLDKNDGKVYVLAFGPQIEEQIVDIMDGGDRGPEFARGDITNPATGFNLLIVKTVPDKKELTDYSVQVATSPTPLANWEQLRTQLHDLDKLVQNDTKSYDEMVAFLQGAPQQTAPAAGAAATNQTVGTGFEAPAMPKLPNTAAPSPGKTDEFGRAVETTAPPVSQPPQSGTPPATAQNPAALRQTLDRLRSMRQGTTT